MRTTSHQNRSRRSPLESGITTCGLAGVFLGRPMTWGLTAGGWGRIAVESVGGKGGEPSRIYQIIGRLWRRLKKVGQDSLVGKEIPAEFMKDPKLQEFRLGPEHYESMLRMKMFF